MPAAAPLHPRRHVLAELEARIAQAEAARARHLHDLEGPPGARRARVLLRLAEERLARLRRSREALLADGPGEGR